ncbi:peroxiredoxin-like family protein [Maribacter sp. 2307ULW6-5]|uniref:peroxiredoxin-like family protein n=1 Tax=Maribacter sp. 2307ULW6-5 TaxID=3386275 RepID=UPI0039BD5591
MLVPKKKVPHLEVPLINDTQWSLEAQRSETFTLITFYRGLHCPICKKHLEGLAKHLKAFSERGVNLIAISCDGEAKAKEAGEKWNIPELPIGYGLKPETAKEWGLFLSKGISEDEPKTFSEPGLFLIRPDQTLYASSIQTMPFARPQWKEILEAVDYVKDKDYPARGGAS